MQAELQELEKLNMQNETRKFYKKSNKCRQGYTLLKLN